MLFYSLMEQLRTLFVNVTLCSCVSKAFYMIQIKDKTPEKALIVGIVLPLQKKWETEDALDELELLADTAGAVCVGRLVQNLSQVNRATYIGTGKVQELKEMVEKHKANLIIFDDDLSPSQIRNLEREIKIKLIDRTGLILDIFAARAKTSTAKAQVEMAQLEYLRSRLTRQWTHLSRQGGIGMKGPGETQIETDRRLIGDRIAVLRRKLAEIEKQRAIQRKGREDQVKISLVGYTNAGKSTLMNAMSEASVLAENRLFATLDTTTRTVFLEENKKVLVSDTVGFIRKLPHKLVESFKSTLDEVREANLLMHVVDITHPCYEDHIRVVNQTLLELGVQDKPILMVFNKVDALAERDLIGALLAEYPQSVAISAQRGIGIDALRKKLMGLIEADFVEIEMTLPVSAGKAYGYLRQISEIQEERYEMMHNPENDQSEYCRHLKIRFAPKHKADLSRLLENYPSYQPLVQTA